MGCAPICTTHSSISRISASTSAFAWISANAHKFGFILRYPEDKVAETGISYEPWHYRYVGRYHATKIHTLGLCLEEYVAEYLQ